MRFIGHIFAQMDSDVATRGKGAAHARVVPALLELLDPEDESKVRLGCSLVLVATEVAGDGITESAIYDLHFIIDDREIYLGRASTRWAMLDEVASALKLSKDNNSPMFSEETWGTWSRK